MKQTYDHFPIRAPLTCLDIHQYTHVLSICNCEVLWYLVVAGLLTCEAIPKIHQGKKSSWFLSFQRRCLAGAFQVSLGTSQVHFGKLKVLQLHVGNLAAALQPQFWNIAAEFFGTCCCIFGTLQLHFGTCSCIFGTLQLHFWKPLGKHKNYQNTRKNAAATLLGLDFGSVFC